MADFTIIIYQHNPEATADTMEALKQQDADMQVLTYDAADGISLGEAFNRGMDSAAGEYVCFIDDDALYDAGCFETVAQAFEEDHELGAVSLKPVFISPQKGEIPYLITPEKSGVYSVTESPEQFQFNLKAYFFRLSTVKGIKFDEGLGTECCNKFLIDYFIKNKIYRYVEEKTVRYHKAAECDASNFADQFDKKWYFDNVEQFLLKYAREAANAPETYRTWLQMAIYYLLSVRVTNNYQSKSKGVLDKEETFRFFDLAGKVLAHLDDTVIMMKQKLKGHGIDRVIRLLLMRQKFQTLGLPYHLTEKDGFFCFDYGDHCSAQMINANREKVRIFTMHYEKGCLEVDFRITPDKIFGKDNITIKVTCDGKPVEVREIMDYPLITCFGFTMLRRYGGRISVPLDQNQQKQKIQFAFSWDGKDYPMAVRGERNASKIGLKGTYWRMNRDHIVYPEGNAIIVRKLSFLQWLKKEKKYSEKYLDESPDRIEAKKKLRQRWAMIFAQMTCRKRIWVTFDKIYKAGDNGEYMYHYIHDNVKDVKIYYVISENSLDYERLKKEHANILIQGSFKCHLTMAKAEVILATHPSIWEYCGFAKEDMALYRDLFNAKLVCIQHGLTTMNIAQYQNRIFDDTGLYCCAAECEVENIKRPIYGYDDCNIRLTGLARFDGLHNADKKQVLITPTWRRNIVNAGIAFDKKEYNENFKSTEYFHIFNSLINDERLIECAERNGYRLIYLLHPAISSQIDDFDKNEHVEILKAAGDMNYEKILTESSLMVTDYSGIQFDFAYMRKPIVYYHPASLPPQYEEGVYKYETMGFGPIEHDHEGLVNTLCDYLDNHCAIKEEYAERANQFFAFSDFNNCRRIFEETDKWVREAHGC